MMSELTILFTSAGRRVSLIRLFLQAMEDLSISHRIVTADSRADAAARFAGDLHVAVPKVMEPTYVVRLLELCATHQVSLLVPLIDTELPILASHRESFAAIGTRLLLSSSETVEIGRDKRNTEAFFQSIGVATPRILSTAELKALTPSKFPLVVKPADGSGSLGFTVVSNVEELRHSHSHISHPIVQDYICGDEYTLDILIDFCGCVRCVVPRLRIEVRAGEVSKAMTVRDAELIESGRRVAQALPNALGCITLQAFRDTEGLVQFIELNPRFGGGFPLAAAAGANFPRWIVEWLLGGDPEISMDGWRNGMLMLRYDEGIFVDRSTIS